jgi:rhamnogalacturonyl hydrolase YesR
MHRAQKGKYTSLNEKTNSHSIWKVVSLIAVFGAAACASSPRPLSDALERKAIVDVMTAAAEWQLAHPSKHPPYDWTQAPFYIGLNAFAPLSRDPERYLGAARRNGEENRWRPGLRPLCADDHAITQSYFHLYRIDKDKTTIEPALQTLSQMILYPFDESLEFENWEKTWRQWTWCDALFMSPPALAMAANATGDRRYRDFMHKMWWKVTDYLYDKDEHLYYRDSRFFGTKTFWSRGNGWVLAGLARVLQELPADDPQRARYVELFREMAPKIASLQAGDGYWRSNLLDPAGTPRPETSGTAFYIYALAWGVNEGLLDRATYEPVIRRGWSALVRAVHPNGMLGWVQRIGDQPGDTSASGTEIYGVGALLLAGSEVYQISGSGLHFSLSPTPVEKVKSGDLTPRRNFVTTDRCHRRHSARRLRCARAAARSFAGEGAAQEGKGAAPQRRGTQAR